MLHHLSFAPFQVNSIKTHHKVDWEPPWSSCCIYRMSSNLKHLGTSISETVKDHATGWGSAHTSLRMHKAGQWILGLSRNRSWLYNLDLIREGFSSTGSRAPCIHCPLHQRLFGSTLGIGNFMRFHNSNAYSGHLLNQTICSAKELLPSQSKKKALMWNIDKALSK